MLDKTHKPKKSFGQNFLTDKNILSKIAAVILNLKKEFPKAQVIEFGTGQGALTEVLLLGLEKFDASLISVERDRDLIPILTKKFSAQLEQKKLELDEADAVKFDLGKFEERLILCGNLPYHLSASFFFKSLDDFDKLDASVYLIQKEVADRIVARPNNKTYGLMSVLLQSRFEVRKEFDVPKTAFFPPPKIESSLITLKAKSSIDDIRDWRAFEGFVKKAFSQRRKTLRNTLALSEEIFEAVGLTSKLRPENLSPQDFVKLFQAASK